VRQLLAGISSCAVGLRVALPVIFMVSPAADIARSDPSGPDTSSIAAPSVAACGSSEVSVHSNVWSDDQLACGTTQKTQAEVAQARAYLVETASPGYTMTLQGPELAIGRLHPEFVVRLEHAIREARNAGLSFAGVFSAYRPPAFGVGGFSDKFNSLHTYGLAVDMRGIGNPGSPEAQLWHEIAAKNGVVCPYGPRDRAEWNHCQPTSVKMILADNPLRDTVSSAGPFDLETMFEAGNPMIGDLAGTADYFFPAPRSPTTDDLESISLNGWKAQKTIKGCQDEWRALRAANQRTTTQKQYVAECQTGGARGRLAFATNAAAAVISQAKTQKTVKVCQEEWRALRIANQRTTIEKTYVAQCRAGHHG
jgi:hypothetical protein